MWYENEVFYQIYPLGFCGAPSTNDGVCVNRIQKIESWLPHVQKLGAGAIVLNPVFESDAHGYDTRDFAKIDVRLGTNENFANVCKKAHGLGIKILLDGVFNHVGRGFWAFQDVLKNKANSQYVNWFHIDFARQGAYDDGFWYDGWEGHNELVRLNLHNEDVVNHLLQNVGNWVDEFDIDGLRLDVAYSVLPDFMRKLRKFTDEKKQGFFLYGEMLHGDCKTIANNEMLHSATNYECYKGMHSSLNDLNFFEIEHSLNRQFGKEAWTLYKDLRLFSFVDNHDVTRASSVLMNEKHLPLIYGLLFGMPGYPCVYYGSEWGEKGEKQAGSDADLRPAFEAPIENDMFDFIKKLCGIYKHSKALKFGSYSKTYLTNQQFVFMREFEGEAIFIALNAGEQAHTAVLDVPKKEKMTDKLTGEVVTLSEGLLMPAFSVQFLC